MKHSLENELFFTKISAVFCPKFQISHFLTILSSKLFLIEYLPFIIMELNQDFEPQVLLW